MINWKHRTVKPDMGFFASQAVEPESCSCQFWQKQVPFSGLKMFRTSAVLPLSSSFPPNVPFQTTQVTLTHIDVTTGFDSRKLKWLRKFRLRCLLGNKKQSVSELVVRADCPAAVLAPSCCNLNQRTHSTEPKLQQVLTSNWDVSARITPIILSPFSIGAGPIRWHSDAWICR